MKLVFAFETFLGQSFIAQPDQHSDLAVWLRVWRIRFGNPGPIISQIIDIILAPHGAYEKANGIGLSSDGLATDNSTVQKNDSQIIVAVFLFDDFLFTQETLRAA